MPTRRSILTMGAAGILVVGAGVAGARITHDIEPARAPWREAGAGEDPRLRALSYAILAPSPHNRQPWLVRLEGTDRLTLFADLDRLLPTTDPFNRQVVIGLGAFLELLVQAAAEDGRRAEIDLWPEGEPQPTLDARPVAHVSLVPDAGVTRDPLFAHVLGRRTVRAPFGPEPVAAESLDAIAAAVRTVRFAWTDDRESGARIADLSNRGWIVETGTERTHHESTKLTRIGADEVIANPDGISLHGPSMEAYHPAGVLTHARYRRDDTMAFRGARSFYAGLIDTAAAWGWLSTPDDARRAQIRAGRDWVRLQLAATAAGIAIHPVSQVLQEFPEMRPLYDAFHDHVGLTAPARVQGLFRFWHAAYPDPSPRWPLSSRLEAT